MRIGVLLPNTLTALRLLLAAAFIFVAPAWWLPLLIAAAVSDVLDGAIARALGAQSWVGGFFDATADKVFVVTVGVVYCIDGRLSLWEVCMLLQRDTIVLLLSLQLAWLRHWHGFRQMPARPLGKLTTALLLICFAVLAVDPRRGTLETLLVYAAAAVSVAAGLDYSGEFERASHCLLRREDEAKR